MFFCLSFQVKVVGGGPTASHNEAFAMVTLLATQELNLDPNKVNVNGGACALGHPLGASGARIIVTLIYALKRLNKQRGIASICIGGGEATAIAIEII